jgi:aminopeptidase YwaD
MKYFFFLFVFLFCFSTSDLNCQTINPFYQEIAGKVRYDSVYTRLQAYENFGNKGVYSQELKNTAQWIIGFYRGLGYTDIQIDTIDYHGTELYNIIVTKTGTIFPEKYFIIDGHYDATNCPGTDDNGSGTVIVMEVARLLKDISTKYSVKFIHFTGEEAGYVGSRYYINNTVIPQNLDIMLLLNVDMVGGTAGMNNNIIKCERDEGGQSQNNAPSAAYTDTLATLTRLYSSLQTVFSNAYGSDYMPFEENGEIITGYYEYNENPYNHTSGDILIHMDPLSVFELAKASTAATLYFSNAYNSAGFSNKTKGEFNIYPNPAYDLLFINANKTAFLDISDLCGGNIFATISIEKGMNVIDVQMLQSGMYIYTLTEKYAGLKTSGKLIIN